MGEVGDLRKTVFIEVTAGNGGLYAKIVHERETEGSEGQEEKRGPTFIESD